MYPDNEIRHLLELMPASGRMKTKLVDNPNQMQVIVAMLPRPWESLRPITINFDLWGRLNRQQRDLLLLRTVSWLTNSRLLKPNLYQGLVAAGSVGFLVELFQTDAIGMVTAGGLVAIAGTQIWRNSRGPKAEIAADEAGIRVALRRGYTDQEAARSLLTAIEAVADIEARPLDFTELIRCQNLRKLAGFSSIDVPATAREL
jgi:hypothetical protein